MNSGLGRGEVRIVRHRGFRPWGSQTGSFATCYTDFVPKNFHLFTQPPIINNFLLPQREEGRKEQGLKIGKGNSSKVNETQGFLTLGYSNWTICNQLS